MVSPNSSPAAFCSGPCRKRFSPLSDGKRPVTTLEHLYRDHEEGPAWSYLDRRQRICRALELHR